MAVETATAETVAYEGQPEAEAPNASSQLLDVKPQMIGLAWLAFGIVAAVLAKALWKPVLQGLEKREAGIKDALDAAEKSRAEVAETGKRIRTMRENADRDARDRVEAASHRAEEILQTARQEAEKTAEQRIQEAERQIAIERETVVAEVQKESLRTLGETLERVLSQQLTDEQKHAYQEAMLREVHL